MAAKEAKQKGYRIRTVIFVPTTGDITSNKEAILFAEKYQALPDGAPKGSKIEKFDFRSGFEGEAE